MQKLKLLIILLLLLPLQLSAKRFSNSFISFELPPKWQCHAEGIEWVCQVLKKKGKQEAIIVFTAKVKGPSDSLSSYYYFLKTPKILKTKTGKKVPSKVISTRQVKINNHIWVDSMHTGSEVVSYITRYLGTVKNNVAILITFSAHKRLYAKYTFDFLNAIKSLRVTATNSLLSKNKLKKINTRPIDIVDDPFLANGPGDNEMGPAKPSLSICV